MRSRLNLALVLVAGSLALVLTVVRRSPEGVVAIGLDTQEVRAAPGEALSQRHDLSALKIFNLTLLRIKERYVDPSRIDPKKMLYAALDSVQFNIPEVLVEPDTARNKVTVEVNDKREVFDTEDVDSPWRLAKKLKHIFQFVEVNMNAGADLAKVEYAAVNGMLSTLDPHSILMDPEQARDMDVSTSGKFGGLGIVIKMIDRKLMVVKPMKDTPAWRAGIKAKDHIVKINNELTDNLTSQDAVDRMRGDPHTPVTLWIERKGHDGLMRFDIVRDIIHVSQVDHKLLENHVGYIRVHQFSKGVASDVADAMREMQAQGATAWILDLRGNPGGLLEEAVQLADLFVDSGTVVTTVSGRERDVRRAEPGGDISSPLAVLVNGGSASASEIVTGALKNLDRAIIIGTRTFGKGSVQELYDNDDHSKLKLTIAQYLTPGDRSIQNLGIVPDILLHRMWVPDKLDGDDSFIRLLPPSHTYGEKDLDAHLVSTYAKNDEKPEYELPYLIEKKADDDPADDEDDDTAGDDVVEDFEMRFADQLVSTVDASTRPKLVAGARQLVEKTAADEQTKLVAALGKLGIDWSPKVAQANETGAPNVDVSLQVTPAGTLHAGDDITLTATAKNTGTATAFRVLPRIDTDDSLFEDLELPIGKLGPGETKTFTTKLKVPLDTFDRVDQLALDVREAPTGTIHTATSELNIQAAPRPVFAYAWQLIDEGNGDGLVQPGESYKLVVSVKNAGLGPTHQAAVALRNVTGDGVTLGKSRVELKAPLAPGQSTQIELPLSTDASLKADEVVLELVAYDSDLDVQTADKLHFPVVAAVPGRAARGTVTVKSPIAIHAGAADESSVVGEAPHGASYAAIGTFGGYTKVKLDQGGSRIGFVASSDLSSGGTGTGSYMALWNAIPPRISLTTKMLETSADTYKLEGSASDDQHVEDVYALVANENAKIDQRKVFYRSNRGGKNGKLLDFQAELPLWPGSNMITVVARSSADVRTTKTLFVYRDPPRTASAR